MNEPIQSEQEPSKSNISESLRDRINNLSEPVKDKLIRRLVAEKLEKKENEVKKSFEEFKQEISHFTLSEQSEILKQLKVELIKQRLIEKYKKSNLDNNILPLNNEREEIK